MDWAVLVHAAIFAGALFQVATGLGFGLIACPVLLMSLDDVAAVQVTILLSLMIAVIMSPALWRGVDRSMLGRLLLGTILGLPIGMAIYLVTDLAVLELLAGGVVLAMGFGVFAGAGGTQVPGPPRRGGLGDGLAGCLSGIMSACLAMPGPPPAAWMATRSFDKTAIRSTVLVLFVPSYALALVLQICTRSVTEETLVTAVALLPVTLAGLVCGRILAPRIDERRFKLAISILLGSTALALLLSSLRRFVGG
jgi:uncharacterized membrane protein YfcA